MVQGGGGAMYSGCGSVSGVCGVFVLVPAWCACCTSKQIVYAAQQRKAGITHTASIEAQCVFIAVTLLQQSQRQLLPQQSGTRCAVSCKMTSPCFFSHLHNWDDCAANGSILAQLVLRKNLQETRTENDQHPAQALINPSTVQLGASGRQTRHCSTAFGIAVLHNDKMQPASQRSIPTYSVQ